MATQEQPTGEQMEVFVPNLLTNYEETVRRMAEVRKDGAKEWLRDYNESRSDLSQRSPSNIRKQLQARKPVSRLYIDGWGGVHRWRVDTDGSVSFMAEYGSREDASRAQELGFDIFGEVRE